MNPAKPALCLAAFLAQNALAASLDGAWTLSVRYRGAGKAWGAPEQLGQVQVPGSFFPDLPKKGREVELVFERDLPQPDGSAAHAVAEFDSVDYEARVELMDPSGQAKALAAHRGYFGRFAAVLPPWQAGQRLRVRVFDRDRGAKGFDEAVVKPAGSIQGIDDLAFNRAGIIESCRLRPVGPYYLRNAFAALISSGALRIAADVVSLDKDSGPAQVSYSLTSGGRELGISGSFPGPWQDIPVPAGLRNAVVRISVGAGGKVSDAREVPLTSRRLTVAGNRILLDGKPVFLKGTVAFETSRLLSLDQLPPTQRYLTDQALVEDRISVYIREFQKAHGQLVRFAHHVPVRLFHQRLAQAGLLAYQDFPLAFNIDFQRLPPEEILRRFDEFLWRVSAEPAVAVIALHNEAEIADSRREEKEKVLGLMRAMARRAEEFAPHLLVVGVSGGGGTAVFPPDPAYALPEVQVADVHGYPGSGWQPLVGYRELAEHIRRFDASGGRPVIWSELGGGWPQHFEGLLSVQDSLQRFSGVKVFKFGPRKLDARQFYALLSCKAYDRLPKERWLACVAANAKARNDRRLIARAKDHFFAGRDKVLAPPDRDLHRWALRLVADWLCAQIYEARLAYFAGRPMSGTTPWDAARVIGFPVSPGLYGLPGSPALEEHRAAVGRAYAPLALYARPPQAGRDLPVFILNDGPDCKGRLSVLHAGEEVYGQEVQAPGGQASQQSIPAQALPARLAGDAVSLSLVVAGQEAARYEVGLPKPGD